LNALARIPTFKATDKQQTANGLLGSPAKHILLRGGSRSGKTFIIVRRIVMRALRASGSRHATWRLHFNHAKASIGGDTFPKVIKLCFPQLAGLSFNHEGVCKFPNGSEYWLAGLDDKERVEKILGMEFATNHFNEISHIPFHGIEIGHSRLAQKVEMDLDPQLQPYPEGTDLKLLPLKNFYDMNPGGKRHYSYQMFVQHKKPGTQEELPNPHDYVSMQMNPDDNRENLPPEYFDILEGMSKTKRKRFKEGEWANDVEGALWNDTMLDRARIAALVHNPEEFAAAVPGDQLVRVVVGVDPSGAKTDKFAEVHTANAIGIVVCGLGASGLGYVLEDCTLTAGPGEWGKVVVDAYYRWKADKVIVEQNFGGGMAEFVLQTADPLVPVKMINSSRGKAVRAEPVAALYEDNQLKVKHMGFMGELEDQMAAMMPNPTGYTGDGSPDRLDAKVFAITELMLQGGYTLNNL
jgi:phage terminase large subunit-like protein